jgi:hypothetical protein
MGPKKREFKDVEDVPRHSFTPGWSRAISEVEGLPVKKKPTKAPPGKLE